MPCLTLHTIIIKSFLSLFSSSTMKLQQNFFLIFQSGPRECECMKFHFFTASLLTLHGYITSTISRIYTKALQSQINLFQCEQEDSLGSEWVRDLFLPFSLLMMIKKHVCDWMTREVIYWAVIGAFSGRKRTRRRKRDVIMPHSMWIFYSFKIAFLYSQLKWN